jgi:hypothetical protein
VHYLFQNPCAWWQQRIGRRYITRVTDNVKVTYAATESEVINAKGTPNLYASILETIDIWKDA